MASDDDDDDKHKSSFMTYFMVAIVGLLLFALLLHKSPTPVIHVIPHENSFARALKNDNKAMRYTQIESDSEVAADRAARDTEAELARGAADREGLTKQLTTTKETRLSAPA